MAFLYLKETPRKEAVSAITNLYDIEKDQADTDFDTLAHQLDEMIFMGRPSSYTNRSLISSSPLPQNSPPPIAWTLR